MIYLVRHGQTEFNVARRHQGHVDSPLTELGRVQARKVGEALAHLVMPNDTAIFSSPLGRALHTARLVAQSARVENDIFVDPDLKEIAMGSWEGLTEAEIAELWPDSPITTTREGMSFYSPDGEGLDALASRVDCALQRVADCHAATCIVVSHGITGRVLRARYLGLDPAEALGFDAPQDKFYRLDCGQVVGVAS